MLSQPSSVTRDAGVALLARSGSASSDTERSGRSQRRCQLVGTRLDRLWEGHDQTYITIERALMTDGEPGDALGTRG